MAKKNDKLKFGYPVTQNISLVQLHESTLHENARENSPTLCINLNEKVVNVGFYVSVIRQEVRNGQQEKYFAQPQQSADTKIKFHNFFSFVGFTKKYFIFIFFNQRKKDVLHFAFVLHLYHQNVLKL